MATRNPRHDLSTLDGIKTWLRGALTDYTYTVTGIATRDNRTLPLPKEPALVAKVIEVTVTEHAKRKAYAVPGLDVLEDLTGRGYPDMMLAGRALGSRKLRKKGRPTVTKSRITLGPFDSYYRRPAEPIPGVGVAYGDFDWHLDIIALYDWEDADVENIELLVVETWRVASMKCSSTTCSYIGAVNRIEDLRAERGEFDSRDDFYGYWRAMPVKTKATTPAETEDLPLDEDEA